MKPLYIDYSGSDAPKWVPFAKKKMQQYVAYLDSVGLPFGRKYLKFDDVMISFLMTPLFSKLRIQTGVNATFFGLYSVFVNNPDTSTLYTYQYAAAFDDDGNEQWRLAFAGHETFTSSIERRLLGCSSDGSKVLVKEVESSVFRIKEITNGSLTDTAEFDLATAGYSSSFAGVSSRVSLSGTRAIVAGPSLSSFPIQYVVFVYDKETVPQIQAVEVDVDDASTGSLVLLGSSDLSTSYFAHQGYLLLTAGTQPSISIPRVTRTAGVDEYPPTNTVDTLSIDTISGASHYIVIGEVTSSSDGELAVSYSTVTPPTFSSIDTNQVKFYVHVDGVDVEVGTPVTDFLGSGASALLESAQSVFSLREASVAVAYRLDDAISGASITGVNGYIMNGSPVVVAEDIVAVNDDGTLVLADGSKYIVRRSEGDFELVDDTPYDFGRTLHTFDTSGNVYGEFNALIQPTAERFARKWVPETDPDTGDVTGYPTRQNLGATPLSIAVSPIDPEVEETASLVGSQALNVYVQRVVQS